MSVTDSIRDQASRWFVQRGYRMTFGEALVYLQRVKAEHVDVVLEAWRADLAKSGSYRSASVALVIALVEGMRARRAA